MRTLEDPIKLKKMQSDVMRKHGVANIQQVPEVAKQSRETQYRNWRMKLQSMFPLKMNIVERGPLFRIDEEDMEVYILREKASVVFLQNYGHRIKQVFGKFHFSVGLVSDGVLYQVLRFERHKDAIILVDFGTRRNYFNPNYYSKVMQTAQQVGGIEEFSADVPRSLASPELIQSMGLTLTAYGSYDVFIKEDSKLKKITIRDDLNMLKDYDYVTSDYLDHYNSRADVTASSAVSKKGKSIW